MKKSSAETMAGKRKQMSTPQKEVVISLFEGGVNQRRIAEILGVSQSGVSKFLKRFNQRETCENERRSGRPRKTDDRGDRKILCCMKTDRRQSLTKLRTKRIMSCQTRFFQGLVVDDYDSMGSEREKFVRPSPFGLRTDIAAYIGVDQSLDGL
jgi:transposase